MSGEDAPLGLFQGYGIEIEYMLVDAATLDVAPVAEAVLRAASGGSDDAEIDRGELAWSNELAAHVLELKTNGPAPALEPLPALFQAGVTDAIAFARSAGATLMPGAMHPWMDPARELVLFPNEYTEVYRTFDRIFDCRGHGWANLQAVHINLPFASEDELGRLHAAVRTVLPILPALAASSPFADARASGLLDTRLEHYRGNARRVPSVSGRVIPEPLFTRAAYLAMLDGIYADLAPHDPDGILCHEWVNARGCIVRFDRDAIEIRLLDVQEHPGADLAIAAAVVAVVRALVDETLSAGDVQRALDTDALAAVLQACIARADEAVVDHAPLLEALRWPDGPARAGELWRHLVERTLAVTPEWQQWQVPLQVILDEGCLARRILARAGAGPTRDRLASVYGELCDCLAAGRSLRR